MWERVLRVLDPCTRGRVLRVLDQCGGKDSEGSRSVYVEEDSEGSRSGEAIKLDDGSLSIQDYAFMIQDLISLQRPWEMVLILQGWLLEA